jgi:hypothetical protein
MIYATNIQWDTDGEPHDLPECVSIPDYVMEEYGEDDGSIADYLSDNYGFCVFSFVLETDQ